MGRRGAEDALQGCPTAECGLAGSGQGGNVEGGLVNALQQRDRSLLLRFLALLLLALLTARGSWSRLGERRHIDMVQGEGVALLNILTQQLDTGAAIPQPREVVGRDYRSFVDGEGRRRASMLQGPIQQFLQVLAQQDLEVTQPAYALTSPFSEPSALRNCAKKASTRWNCASLSANLGSSSSTLAFSVRR
jgi:hypothetical protein